MPDTLPAGAATWLTVTFSVLTPCPLEQSVRFQVNYSQAGKLADADLGGFSNLGEVPYTRCSASPTPPGPVPPPPRLPEVRPGSTGA
ncbi:hypothetical protein Raf01_95300 [Rugosimonospora africana]|uniref:Uncharacterized protein n=1 Tax=Rugosimonospora africana TaxID=556532 RepID=A0A8J3VX07_9ACTN|nr:hypothetical protein Raf01_95300 [Rugosimonospora africana]